ncbi:hypothetical protein [Clostridium sp. C2-6-12]|uniref:hypothetical protein n=1 Tax=Clostridium sp. C2-6-12 TaxID=2698832 RepID=UPI00136D0D52|nr:hypothetical protein [Clostridium sp. C2-6-12]
MAITFTEGNAEQAQEWVKNSDLSTSDKEHLLKFIYRFPEIQFYKQTLGGIVPSWLTQKASVLQGIMRNQQIWVKFDTFDYSMPHITLQDTWYRLTLQGMVDDTHSKVFMENKQAYFVGVEMEHYKTMLAIMLYEEDKKVYEFDYNDVHPNQDDIEEEGELDENDYPLDGFGHIDIEAATVAFDSYISMFGHIIAIRLQDNSEIMASKL